MADVAELISEDDPLDKELERKDQTVYIKGYFSPLLAKELIKVLTLSKGS